MIDVEATGHRVEIVDPPDPVAFVQAAITVAPYRHRAVVELLAPLAELTELVPPTVGLLEPIDERRTMLTTGGDSLELLTFHVLSLGVDFHVHESAQLREHMAAPAAAWAPPPTARPVLDPRIRTVVRLRGRGTQRKGAEHGAHALRHLHGAVPLARGAEPDHGPGP